MQSFHQFLETLQPRYYHGSQKQFPIGFKLLPQSEGYVHQEKEVEDMVEKFRPPNKLSRFQSVFLVDDPDEVDAAGGYDDHIYEVMPEGIIEKSNLSWYSELSGNPISQWPLNEVKKIIMNYWKGVSYKSADLHGWGYANEGLWEYRTKSAVILREI